MEHAARHKGTDFQALAISDIKTIEELDNKFTFLQESKKLNLKVPEFKMLSRDVASDLKEYHAEGTLMELKFLTMLTT